MAEITLQMYLVQIIFVVIGQLTTSPLNHSLHHLGIQHLIIVYTSKDVTQEEPSRPVLVSLYVQVLK